MTPEHAILSHLVKKYENSKHLLEPGSSNRRIILRAEKRDFPEYNYENAEIRDAYNEAAKQLESKQIVSLEWRQGGRALSAIIFHLDAVFDAYRMIGRPHPKELANAAADLIDETLAHCETEWIRVWGKGVSEKARLTYRVPSYCQGNLSFLQGLLAAFRHYDELHGESITMRAFSTRCYQNSKQFEREFRDAFLKIAEQYDYDLAEINNQQEMGVRDKLAYLGIYARPELYELAGACTILTHTGRTDLSALFPQGIALSSTLVPAITGFDLLDIQKITLIENKTNYDEYLLTEISPDELVIYHGGFLSPQKRKFIQKLMESLPQELPVRFWADIDLGGFQMFIRLQELIPKVMPMRMDGTYVRQYRDHGLERSEDYLNHLKNYLTDDRYTVFWDAIAAILEHKITIEQEVFLTS